MVDISNDVTDIVVLEAPDDLVVRPDYDEDTEVELITLRRLNIDPANDAVDERAGSDVASEAGGARCPRRAEGGHHHSCAPAPAAADYAAAGAAVDRRSARCGTRPLQPSRSPQSWT